MRAFRVFGLLAMIAAGCEIFLDLAIGPPNHLTPDHTHTAAQIFEEMESWLLIFLVAALGATVAAITARRTWHRYPGLATGALLALIITSISWLVGRHPI
jgi:hypothetical protein